MTRVVGVGAGAMAVTTTVVALITVGFAGAPLATGDVGSALPVTSRLIDVPLAETASPAIAASDAAAVERAPAGPVIGISFTEPVLEELPPPIPPPLPKVAWTPEALLSAEPPFDLAEAPPLGWGNEGDVVLQLQTRMADLGFMRAELIDGYFGGSTWSAVLGFQKFEGLERTGLMNPETWQRLYAPTGSMPLARRGDYRSVEVDLERQIVFVMNGEADARITILNTSTGGNYYYTDPRSGRRDLAYTPTGEYNIYHSYDGLQKAPLGSLYRPLYFTGGWALHGSTSVPAYPASHGCVRLSYDDMDWIWAIAPPEMEVVVHETMARDVLIAKEHLSVSQPFLDAATPESLAGA